MDIHGENWLNQNELRAYPLVDTVVPVSAIVDLHISLPLSVCPEDVSPYVSRVELSPRRCLISISVPGVGVVWTLTTLDPTPMRVNASVDGVVHGAVAYGNRIPDGEIYDLDETTGAIVPSRVLRYQSNTAISVSDGDRRVSGVVKLTGSGGMLTEVRSVDVPGVGQTDVVVFRLEHDIATMERAISNCRTPVESGKFTDVVYTINGIRPDTDGNLNIVLDAEDRYLLQDGFPVVDPTGEYTYVLDDGEPVVFMRVGLDNELLFEDNLDHRPFCAQNRNKEVLYGKNKCRYETPDVDQGIVYGRDGAEGQATAYAGAIISGDTLTVLFDFYPAGIPQQTDLFPKVTIYVDDGNGMEVPIDVPIAEKLGVVGTGAIATETIDPCVGIPDGGDNSIAIGTIESKYRLDSVVAELTVFTVEGPVGLIQEQRNVMSKALYTPAFLSGRLLAQCEDSSLGTLYDE